MITAKDNYTIIRRRRNHENDSDEYSCIGTANTLSDANDLVFELSHEHKDIIIVCDTAFVSDIINRASNIYVYNLSEVLSPKLDRPLYFNNFDEMTSWNWISMWERNDLSADTMLRYVSGVINKRLTTSIACEIIRSVMLDTDYEDSLLVNALEVVEDWTKERKTLDEVSEIVSSLRASCLNLFKQSHTHKRAHLYNSVCEASETYRASDSIRSSAVYQCEDYDGIRVAWSSLVRERIPLADLMIAVGEYQKMCNR